MARKSPEEEAEEVKGAEVEEVKDAKVKDAEVKISLGETTPVQSAVRAAESGLAVAGRVGKRSDNGTRAAADRIAQACQIPKAPFE